MSLKVWLPLNGTLENIGCSNVIVTNNNATIDNAGKIGQCYYFSANAYLKESNYDWTNFNTTEFSLCCWYKEPSPVASGNSQIICIGTNSGWNNIRIGLLRRSSSGYPMFSVSDGSTAVNYNCTATTFTLDTWNHIACTYNHGEIKIYINGVLNKTLTTAIVPILNSSQHLGIGAASNGAEKLTGYLNDVRIYDHCLSIAEVQEISQGLILHYKLNQDISLGENIIPNSLNMPLGSANASTGTWRTAGSNNMTRSRVAILDTPEGDGYGFQNSGIQTANDGSCYGIDNFPTEANTYYVISMWARIIDGTEGYAGFNVYGSTPLAGWEILNKNYYSTRLAANGDWTKCWMSFKTNSSTTRNIYIGITTGSTSVTTQMCNVHIEKGNIFNNKIIEDSSGYNHSGTIIGNLQSTSNSRRYSNCIYSMDGGNNYIETPVLNMPTDAITMNIWFKTINKTPTSDYHMIVDSVGNSSGRQYYEMAIYKTGYFRGGLFVNGSRRADNCSSTTGCNSEWHMITLTYDGIAVKRYFDGIMEKSTSVAITTGLQPTATLRLFKDGYSTYACKEVSLSDFRIYCTALLDTDIKQLYNIGMKIDNKNNVHTFNIIEDNNKTYITKAGNLNTINIYENAYQNLLQYDKTIHEEPDGSLWAHVFHHNNPTNSKFTNTNQDWTNGVYLDADRWYDLDNMLNNLPHWEFLYIQKTTSDAALQKWRWSQQNNPLTATWQTVAADICNYKTTADGYTASSFNKGMYLMKSTSLHMCIANASSGNWYGGIGVASAYQGGIPGYPNTVVTSGSIDLYIRIDNPVKILKEYGMSANEFIEC